ncbi:Transcriptional regulator [Sphingomonas sp. EC-HK361]|nr:Transcriptional regulator [Sphingomonas sp. EC-HK361]
MHMPLKIVKVGNSLGLVLPKDMLAKLRVGLGDQVFVTEQPDGFSVKPHDPAFVEAMGAAENIMREDRDILAVLAR